MRGAYEATYESWRRDPEGFWAEAAEAIHWYRRWDQVLDSSRAPFYRWFSGGLVNTCYNLLDTHVENGRAQQIALIYDTPADWANKARRRCARAVAPGCRGAEHARIRAAAPRAAVPPARTPQSSATGSPPGPSPRGPARSRRPRWRCAVRSRGRRTRPGDSSGRDGRGRWRGAACASQIGRASCRERV